MSAGLPVRRAGDRAVLVDVADAAAAAALAARCTADPLPGQVDVVPGAASVLVVVDRPVGLAAAREHLGALAVSEGDGGGPGGAADEHVVEAVYDGEDLDDVAAATGLSVDEVVAAHTGSPWTVAFAGFAPGFAYLVGGDPRLRVARRPSSRPRVPAGSVGLAGEHSGVYPRESPGGWQLIARSRARLWDVDREPPALLAPGDAVRFVAVDRLDAPADDVSAERDHATVHHGERPPGTADGPGGPALRVERVGLQALVVDAGRPGRAASGVPRSGPVDRTSLVAANAAVGNPPWAPALEVVDGGLVLRSVGECVVALAGAPAPATVATAGGVRRGRPLGAAFALRDGEVLRLGAPASGLRTYLAVRGGLDVPAVLGSRCTDTLSSLGPDPLVAGDVLAVGRAPATATAPAPSVPGTTAPAGADAAALRVVLGPRDDWFTPAALSTLTGQPWRVGARSDRVGLRLSAEQPLRRARDREIPTEGVVTGALQVSPDGDLVLFAADHPVTGGYPVVAVVVDADLDRVGQLRPGADVRFSLADPVPSDPILSDPILSDPSRDDPLEERCAPS